MIKSEMLSLPNLTLLNQEKFLIAFVYTELERRYPPEKMEIIREMFEHLRTSVGINLAALTKTRIKRLKPAEIRAFLMELEEQVRSIIASKEFHALSSGVDNSNRLFDKLMLIKTKLSAGDLHESEKETLELKNMIAAASTGDIMIALFRLFNPGIKAKQPNPEISLKGVKLKAGPSVH